LGQAVQAAQMTQAAQEEQLLLLEQHLQLVEMVAGDKVRAQLVPPLVPTMEEWLQVTLAQPPKMAEQAAAALLKLNTTYKEK
jgi:hypothetical protein